MLHRRLSVCGLLAGGLGIFASCASSPTADAPAVRVAEADGRVRVEMRGQPFTEYHYQGVPRPFCFPVLGPGNLALTRNWPMRDVPDEEHDHPHHRSLWFTHGEVNGQDFWSESDKAGKIVHEKFLALESGATGVIRSANRWVARDGTVVCTDERTLRFQSEGDAKLIDFEITIHANHGPLKFGDTKEGSMGIRLAETMRLKGKVGQGHIVNSAGVRDDATWGKRAAWCDYFGPVDGQTVGVAMFDHPANPRHPTWWHVRDYGLFAANPFGVHDFEKKPRGAGDLEVPAGQSITFRYRIYLHRGDEKEGRVAEAYDRYVKSAKP